MKPPFPAKDQGDPTTRPGAGGHHPRLASDTVTATCQLFWYAKASVSVLGGLQSDRVGRRTVIGMGWIVYALVYGGFAVATSPTTLIVWFLVYGFYYGFAKGTEKALIANLAPASLRGTAFGVYNACFVSNITVHAMKTNLK